MAQKVRIAIDAMGGDYGPSVVVPGAEAALRGNADMTFQFFGDNEIIGPLIASRPHLAAVSKVHHTKVSVRMDDSPIQALRKGRRGSSMWLALQALRNGDADCTVSAGNTGALTAMARLAVRMMPDIGRPALAARWPTLRGESIVLDVGATIGADARHLVNLAIMGSAMARILLHIEKPSVGLLNIGVEDIKGLEDIRAANRVLRETAFPNLVYHGFVEGDDLGRGTVDVVVTEGYTGNIALKTAEGTAKQIAQYLRDAFGRSLRARIGYLFARPALDALRAKMDLPNGGLLLGLDGVVIKSHGGADDIRYARAIEIGYQMVRHDLLAKIKGTHAPDRQAMVSSPDLLPAANPI